MAEFNGRTSEPRGLSGGNLQLPGTLNRNVLNNRFVQVQATNRTVGSLWYCYMGHAVVDENPSRAADFGSKRFVCFIELSQ